MKRRYDGQGTAVTLSEARGPKLKAAEIMASKWFGFFATLRMTM